MNSIDRQKEFIRKIKLLIFRGVDENESKKFFTVYATNGQAKCKADNRRGKEI